MPEGDTIYRLARRMQSLVGTEVESSDFRVPRFATADLSGARVLSLVPRGKHMLTRSTTPVGRSRCTPTWRWTASGASSATASCCRAG